MTNKYMYFVANWKMFGGLNSLNSLNKVITFFKKFKHNKYIKIIYCPPSTLIYPMVKKFKETRIQVGSQNCHQNHSYGAFTGSINSSMLKNGEPSTNFVSYVNKLVEYCAQNNIILLRTIGVIFSDEEKRVTDYVN